MTEPTQKPAALLEAGWAALEAGDIDHARESCDAALSRAPRSVPALSLRAAIAVSMGEFKRARAVCEEAMEIDPQDPRPYIQAAEIELYSDNDEAAIPLAIAAIDRASDEPDFVDAMLIKAAAELGSDLDEQAGNTLRELESCSIDEPPLWFRLGQLWLEVNDGERAQRAFRECIQRESDSADAHHGLGLAAEMLGDSETVTEAWQRVRELDDQVGVPSWHIAPSEFQSLATGLLTRLPDSVRERVQSARLVIAETPSPESLADSVDPRLLASFVGTDDALAEVWLYQSNLERAVGSQSELDEEILISLVHEAMNFFELDEQDLDDFDI